MLEIAASEAVRRRQCSAAACAPSVFSLRSACAPQLLCLCSATALPSLCHRSACALPPPISATCSRAQPVAGSARREAALQWGRAAYGQAVPHCLPVTFSSLPAALPCPAAVCPLTALALPSHQVVGRTASPPAGKAFSAWFSTAFHREGTAFPPRSWIRPCLSLRCFSSSETPYGSPGNSHIR